MSLTHLHSALLPSFHRTNCTYHKEMASLSYTAGNTLRWFSRRCDYQLYTDYDMNNVTIYINRYMYT